MAFIFYNPFLFWKLKDKLGYNMSKELFEFRTSTCKIDRTGQYNKISNVKSLSQYTFQDETRTFLEIIEARLNEIYSKNLPINIFWSGGNDSSLVIAAILHFGLDRTNVTIYGTANSVSCLQDFFDLYINNNFTYVEFDYSKMTDYFKPDYCNITGDGAEEIFGWCGQLMIAERYQHDYSYHNKLISQLDQNNMFDRYWLNLYADVQNIISLYPRQIETIFDLCHFITTNFTWQYASLRFVTPWYEDLSVILPYNYPFYLTQDFLNWSVNNIDRLVGETFVFDSKYEINEVLKQLCPDIDIQYQERGTNIHYTYYTPINYLGYDENYKIVKVPGLTTPYEFLKDYENFDAVMLSD